jgi:hypothetical protein
VTGSIKPAYCISPRTDRVLVHSNLDKPMLGWLMNHFLQYSIHEGLFQAEPASQTLAGYEYPGYRGSKNIYIYDYYYCNFIIIILIYIYVYIIIYILCAYMGIAWNCICSYQTVKYQECPDDTPFQLRLQEMEDGFTRLVDDDWLTLVVLCYPLVI